MFYGVDSIGYAHGGLPVGNQHHSFVCTLLVKGFEDGAVRRFDRYTPEYYLTLSDHAPVYIDVEI